MVGTAGAYKCSHRIMPFQNEFLAQNPIAVQIAGRLEFREYGIMWLVVANRVCGTFILSNDGKITNPWSRLSWELILTESRPEVNSRTDGLFCAIIEVVTVGTYLGFQFNGGDQFLIWGDDQEVPVFGGAEISRQVSLAGIDTLFGDTLLDSNRLQQVSKSVQLLASNDGSTVGGIATGGKLFLFGLPEGLDGGLDESAVVVLFHNRIIGHLQRYEILCNKQSRSCYFLPLARSISRCDCPYRPANLGV